MNPQQFNECLYYIGLAAAALVAFIVAKGK
jgi:hypothetical protein